MKKSNTSTYAINRKLYLLVGFSIWIGLMSLIIMGGELARMIIIH